jgi:hypothetical protein
MQRERLEIMERWLIEIIQPSQFQEFAYYPDISLVDALRQYRTP